MGAAVTAENARPGTRAWWPSIAGKRPGVEAYVDRVSVRPGDQVGLYVDAAGSVHVPALRIGWYGAVRVAADLAGTAVAGRQPKAATVSRPLADLGGMTGTRAIVAPWRLTTLVDTTAWPEGRYLLRLDHAGAIPDRPAHRPQRRRPRPDAPGRLDDDLAGLQPVGRVSRCTRAARTRASATRSFAVSYDRPYQDDYGAGHYLGHDLGLDQLAEADRSAAGLGHRLRPGPEP